ncbi:diacylglycerol kinase family protein [Psychrobacillus sp. FJAT-51614]|uniref:Diacylglycerol kinase family protein n=1 Tax=Psychrobacillus mangrovi TaxID=3117745 RepID=A0ABU8F2I5_9BACI
MNKVVFILNEHAGRGRAKKIWASWKEKIDFPYTCYVTEYRGHATNIARECAQYREGDLLIIAIGGDGTVHEIISGITNYDHVRVGVISAGSGNDFGRTFSVFKTVEQLQMYARNLYTYEKLDFGLLTTKENKFGFVNNAGFGFDAKVGHSVNNSSWKKWLNVLGLGKIAYILFVVKELLTFTRFSFTLHTGKDTLKFDDVWFFVVCNQPFFGGGMKISPQSRPNDQLIEMTVVSKLAKWKLLFIFGTVFFGKHTKYKEVKQFQASNFTIMMHDQVYGHVDGEFSCLTEPDHRYSFSVQSKAWNLAKPISKGVKK